MSKPTPPQCTVRQIVDEKGNPYKAFITEGLWVGTNAYYQSFGGYSKGNKVIPLTTGKAYYDALIKAIEEAKETVYINGWQVSWDALLRKPDNLPGGKGSLRLCDLLMNAVNKQPKLRVYVLLWDDTDPIQTYEDETKVVLESIPRVEVQLQGSAVDTQAKSEKGLYMGWIPFDTLFSHHQKQVVVDGKIAFIGGLDLSYGRYDDDTYDLEADAHGRMALNRYNPCIAAVGTILEDQVIDTHHMTGLLDRALFRTEILKKIRSGAHQIPYEEANPAPEIPFINPYTAHYRTLDPKRQPRMPWQDVEVQIEGPAVSDLALNFVMRWNANLLPTPFLHLPIPNPKESTEVKGCTVQVLRSASYSLRMKEHNSYLQRLQHEESAQSNEQRKKNKDHFAKLRARVPIRDLAQDDIHKSMLNLIYKSEHFIYIENQFFVSNFGEQTIGDSANPGATDLPPCIGPAALTKKDSTTAIWISRRFARDANALPANDICAALGWRIQNTILDCDPRPFHVYITLPVHSELSLNNGMCATQIHWTMQTLVFGTYSLLNRIRRALKQRELMNGGMDMATAATKANEEGESPSNYKTIPLKDCFKYVTLLNLRNWKKLKGGRYVTEQVYGHTKCMIVDDLYALVGSANINDRSLLGSRDSELAVMILGDAHEQQDICGNGKPQQVRQFAQTLRKAIWRKIFGMTGGECSAEGELKTAIDQPANPKSWQKIQAVAQRNTQLYEAAFNFIPRNKPVVPIDPRVRAQLKKAGIDPTGASIWPVWNYGIDAEGKKGEEKQLGKQQGFMPFQTEFWVESHPKAAQAHGEAARDHDQAAQAHRETAKAHNQVAVDLNKTLAFEQTLQPFNAYQPNTKIVRDSLAKLVTQQKDDEKASLAARKATLACEKPSQDAKNRTVEVAKPLLTKISLQEVDASLNAIKEIASPVAPSGWVRFHLQKAIKHRDAAESHVNVAKEHQQAVENHGYTDDPKGQAAAAQLSQVKGYITLLPIHWTEGENNNMSFHTAAITKNDQANPQTEMMAHAEQGPGEKSA